MQVPPYLYRVESNDTATYLTKVTAPDKAAIDYFGKSVSQSGDIFAVGPIIPILMKLLTQEQFTPSTFPTMCRRSTVRLYPLGPGCRSTMVCMRILLWMRRSRLLCVCSAQASVLRMPQVGPPLPYTMSITMNSPVTVVGKMVPMHPNCRN